MKKLVLRSSTISHSIVQSDKTAEARYTIPYEQELNPAQLSAVCHVYGPALVLAGAGTGKTRVLVYRLARLVESGIPPERILLLTFTRKSASEMLRRASTMLAGRCDKVNGGTFHSFAHRTLRRFATELGFNQTFSVIDQSDVEDAMNLIRNRSSAQKTKRRFPQKHTLAKIYGLSVNMCKTVDSIVHEQYPQFIQELDAIIALFTQYVNYKRQHHLMDYDDLLVYLLMLLENKPHIASILQKEHQFIMIDEYQDTNSLQHRIVKGLAGEQANVMAVGDDAQSIYSFRGANHANILEFPSLFKDCALYAIEQNYRSVQPILDCANHVLQSASFGYKKVLFSSLISDEKPMIISTRNEQEQSAFIVQQILELREEGISLNAMAALVRSGYMSFDLEIELAKAQIPFRKFGGFKFIETAHVKDMLAFFRIANNPSDILALHRLLLLLEGVGPGTASIITDDISSGKLNIMNDNGWQDIKRGKDEILRLIALLRNMQDPSLSMNEKLFLAGEFYRPILRKKHDDSAKRWKDIETFSAIAERYTDIATMLSEMALEPPTESAEAGEEFNEDEFFTISTIHSSKGLEWNTVFIPWVLDGKFPPNKALVDEEHIEEERRLIYVAITRAKEHLYLLYPIDIFDRESGMVLGSPSRFLDSVEEQIAGRFALLPDGDEQA